MRLVDGTGNLFARAHYVIHCLVIELSDRLVLVDTGLSHEDTRHPVGRLGLGMALGGGARKGSTALDHVQRLGFQLEDVTDILMTHLDKDHAGGLAVFPHARVHVHPRELDAALQRRTFVHKQRYNAQHFAHNPKWTPLRTTLAVDWRGFSGAVVPDGLPATLLMVPLPGHSAGHCGVAIQLDDGRWLLHCGDAVYHPAWFNGVRPPVAIQVVEAILQDDAAARLSTRERLRNLMREGEVTVFSAHDGVMFRRLGGVE